MNNENSQNQKEKKSKELVGIVVSVGRQKTIMVAVTHLHRHPLYRKAVRKTKRFAVHNDSLEVVVGDQVRIRQSRPISKTKHFIVVEKFVQHKT